MLPTSLYYMGVAGHPRVEFDVDRILHMGLAPSSATDCVVLFGNEHDAWRSFCEILGYDDNDPNLVLIEVTTNGLSIDRCPPMGVFINIRGDAWFCHEMVAPDRLAVKQPSSVPTTPIAP